MRKTQIKYALVLTCRTCLVSLCVEVKHKLQQVEVLFNIFTVKWEKQLPVDLTLKLLGENIVKREIYTERNPGELQFPSSTLVNTTSF